MGRALAAIGVACVADPIDLELLGVLLAPEIDPELHAVVRRVAGDARRGLDLDVLRAIVDPLDERGGAVLDALDVDAPLGRYALVRVTTSADGRRLVSVAPRLVRHVLDFPVAIVDEELRGALRLVRAGETDPDVAEALAPHVARIVREGLAQPSSSPRSSTRRSARGSACCSTRRTRCSPGAPRSRARSIATPTSR